MTERADELVKAILARKMALTSKKIRKKTALSEISRPKCVKTARLDFFAKCSKPVLVRIKYLIVTSDAFLLQNNAFMRTVCTALLW